VSVLDDTLVEGSETVILTLTGTSNGAVGVDATPAVVNIADVTDTAQVSISANLPNAAEPGPNGQFTVSLSAPSSTDTTISYTVTGSATPGAGNDYTTLLGSVTIVAGSTSALIDVSVLNDAIVEGTETVIVTLGSITAGDAQISINGGANSATVNIADVTDTAEVSISANLPNAATPSPAAPPAVTTPRSRAP
jgi:hypothetical protein